MVDDNVIKTTVAVAAIDEFSFSTEFSDPPPRA